jgi:hypothetical protein
MRRPMNKSTIVLACILACTVIDICNAQFYRIRTIGGDTQSYTITDAAVMRDGNLLVGGYRGLYQADTSGVFLMCVSPVGDSLWAKQYDRPRQTDVRAIVAAPDNTCLIVCSSYSRDSQSGSSYCMKIDAHGDTVWTKEYSNGGFVYAYDATRLPDGNFMLCGEITETGSGINDMFTLTIDPDGNKLSLKTYGDTGRSDLAYAIASNDSGYVFMGGMTRSFGVQNDGKYYACIIAISPSGVSQAITNFGTGLINAVTALSDGSFISMGYNVWNIRRRGDNLWNLSWYVANPRSPGPIMQLSDGNFIMFGRTASTSSFTYVMKIGPDGAQLWEKSFYDNRLSTIIGMTPTKSGDLTVIANGSNNTGKYVSVISFINDRYAFLDSLFTFKIQVSGDSLSFTYTPILVPAGMIVGAGGTISWIPKTHGSYMDYVKVGVKAGNGILDTLTFDIIVNDTSKIPVKSRVGSSRRNVFSTALKPLAENASVKIYDYNGRCVRSLGANGRLLWDGKNNEGRPLGFGRYFAVCEGKQRRIIPICFVK